jgi:hypothetical protein
MHNNAPNTSTLCTPLQTSYLVDAEHHLNEVDGLGAGVAPVVLVEVVPALLDLLEQPLLVLVVEGRVPGQQHVADHAHTVKSRYQRER